MKPLFFAVVWISFSLLSMFGQKPLLKISDDEIMIPFGESVGVSTTIDGQNLSNYKYLFQSKVRGVLDYNTAFNDVDLNSLPSKSIVFTFCKIKCCGTETLSLISKGTLGYDFTFKYQTIDKTNKYSPVNTSSSKNLTSFTFKGTPSLIEAIVLYDLKIIN